MNRMPRNPNHVQPSDSYRIEMYRVATIYIGPTYTLDHQPAYSPETLTELKLYNFEFAQSMKSFFSDELPVKIVERNHERTGKNIFVSLLDQNCYLHCRADGYHVLVKVYNDDDRAIQAQKLLLDRLLPPPPPPPSND